MGVKYIELEVEKLESIKKFDHHQVLKIRVDTDKLEELVIDHITGFMNLDATSSELFDALDLFSIDAREDVFNYLRQEDHLDLEGLQEEAEKQGYELIKAG